MLDQPEGGPSEAKAEGGRECEENRLRELKNEHTRRNLRHDVRTFPRAHGSSGL